MKTISAWGSTIKVGDLVLRVKTPTSYCAQQLSVNRLYEVEFITAKGLLVFKNFLMLVQSDEVVLVPLPKKGRAKALKAFRTLHPEIS